MPKRNERKLELLYGRLAYYEHCLKTASIKTAADGYKDSIKRVQREIRRLEGKA